MNIPIPYGSGSLDCAVPDERLRGVFVSSLSGLQAASSQDDIVRSALASPVGSPRLRDLARGRRNIVIITSDHTRPLPSRITMPLLLAEIRSGNPDARVTILVATGMHRATRREELESRFGEEISGNETIVIHDCRDETMTADLGLLPSGGRLLVNRIATAADLLVAEGFIEPHLFAGFSGGRKAVLPGIASYRTVLANHCAAFIGSECARPGVLDGNPIHRDMLHAGRAAGLAFILNVVLDAEKRIVAAFAGDMEAAHREGCALVSQAGSVDALPADIVVTSNGGYPLDMNIYQSMKGMMAAEACCRAGGAIIMASECREGHGSKTFFESFAGMTDPALLEKEILGRDFEHTVPDQWQTQILCRLLRKFTIVFVTKAPKTVVERFGMIHASSFEEALATADRILGRPDATVTVIPDGVSVIVRNVS